MSETKRDKCNFVLDVPLQNQAYLVTGPLFSVFFTRIFSLETTRFSVVDAVRSCMMGPMMQVARGDVVSSPAQSNDTVAKEPNRHLGSDTLF